MEHHAGGGLGPLSWLRSRLMRTSRQRPIRASSTLVPAFPPPVGRGQALRQAHRALRALFERQDGLRQVLPYLSLLERALGRKGSKALSRLPAPVLQRSLEQLEDLLSNENIVDLHTLRSRIIESLALRSVTTLTPPPRDSTPAKPVTLFGLDVEETSYSAFDEAERSWPGTMRSTATPQ
jgi:hypothetical protein